MCIGSRGLVTTLLSKLSMKKYMSKKVSKKIYDLREVLKEELKTMYRMVQIMQPTSEEEFIAVALPNLHLKVHELITNK